MPAPTAPGKGGAIVAPGVDPRAMARVTLALLGGFRAHLGSGAPVRVTARKAQALLAYLAVRHGERVPRDTVAALLWGDTGEPQAYQSLRQALVSVRRALPRVKPPILVSAGGMLALRVSAVDVDVARFEHLAAQTREPALEQAVALYRGDLLEGFRLREESFESWLRAERDRLRGQAVAMLERLSTQDLRPRALDDASRLGQRLLTRDPTQESVHRSLMRLYLQSGRRAAALRQYQLCVDVLQRELGVQPEVATRTLYQTIISQDTPTPVHSRVGRARRVAPYASGAERLIGREGEMGQLQHALEEAWQKRGCPVMISGEAGIGKTRLIEELTERAGSRGGRIFIGRCVESEQILPFGPWLNVLRSEEMRGELADLATTRGRWRAQLAYLLPELGAPTAAPASSGDVYLRIFEAVTHVMSTVTAQRPSVLVLEDMHWADELSVRLFTYLGRRSRSWPLLLVASARSEELRQGSRARLLVEIYQEGLGVLLKLPPLSEGDTVTLVRQLAAARTEEHAVEHLAKRIWRLSEGNPFMVVETMRAVHQGTKLGPEDPLPLAHRIQHVIAGRLHHLSGQSTELAAVAAVIGREFDFALVQRAVGMSKRAATESIEELVRHGILHSVAERFAFAHDYIREVVYRLLLPPRRRLLHEAAAEAIETLHARDLEPHWSALGAHYREAEVWSKAVGYLRRAGLAAASRGGNREAVIRLEQALDGLAHLPETRETLEEAFEIRLELWPSLHQLDEVRRGLARLREGEALAEQLDDDHRRGRVCAFGATVHNYLGKLDEAFAMGTRAREIANRVGDLRLRILTTGYLEQLHYYRGDYDRAVALATENLADLPRDWLSEFLGSSTLPAVYDRYWLTVSLAQLGRFSDAAEHYTAAIPLAEATRHAWTMGVAYGGAFTFHLLKGNWVEARPLIEHAIAVTRDVTVLLPYMIAPSAWVLAQLGAACEALERIEKGEELLEHQTTRGHLANHGWLYHVLGRACFALGRVRDAQRLATKALNSSRGQFGYAAHAIHLLADVMNVPESGAHEDGEAYYLQAAELAAARGMRPLVAHCHLGLARLYRRTDKRQLVPEHLATATAMYREMDMGFWVEQAESEAVNACG